MNVLTNLAAAAVALAAALGAAAQSTRIAVYSHTAGFRHESIEAGVAMLEALGAEHGFSVEHTEDPAWFESRNLGVYAAIVWLNTTGSALSPTGKAAFQAYVERGGGFVGVHAAADTEHVWPWYGELLGCGAWFASHPDIQAARVLVRDADHPSTRHLPAALQLTDEWYNFEESPSVCTRVLLALDEQSYSPGPGAMGADHPLAWAREFVRGRAWYTALGHRPELYAQPEFREHVLGGILWAARRAE